MSYTLALFLTFVASFVFIFLKAFQQRNVAFDHHAWIVPTSMLMALVEVYVIANIATKGFSIPIVLAIGGGSGLGGLAAALVLKKIFTSIKTSKERTQKSKKESNENPDAGT